MLIIIGHGYAQSTKIIVSAGSDTLTASGDYNNDDKILLIKSSLANNPINYLTVNLKEETPSNWKHRFLIYDSSNLIGELKPMMQNEYCIRIKDILPKLQKSKTYKLMMAVIPQDKTKAFMVQIRPLLVCILKLDN